MKVDHRCRCQCHYLAEGKVKHCVACCTPCPICKDGITKGFMKDHIDQVHGHEDDLATGSR